MSLQEHEIEQRDLYDRPPSVLKPWGEGRVTLLGDSVHAMMPNLGQGEALVCGRWGSLCLCAVVASSCIGGGWGDVVESRRTLLSAIHVALGGCQAIEDACVLAEELTSVEHSSEVASKLRNYNNRRLARSATVQGLSRFASDIIIQVLAPSPSAAGPLSPGRSHPRVYCFPSGLATRPPFPRPLRYLDKLRSVLFPINHPTLLPVLAPPRRAHTHPLFASIVVKPLHTEAVTPPNHHPLSTPLRFFQGFDTPFSGFNDPRGRNYNGFATRVMQPLLPIFFSIQFNFLYSGWRNERFALEPIKDFFVLAPTLLGLALVSLLLLVARQGGLTLREKNFPTFSFHVVREGHSSIAGEERVRQKIFQETREAHFTSQANRSYFMYPGEGRTLHEARSHFLFSWCQRADSNE